MNKFIMAGLAVLALAASAFGFYLLGPSGANGRVVEIPAKAGTAAIGRILKENGLVRSAAFFRTYAVFTGQARKLKAGEYAFPARPWLPAVVHKIAAGQIVHHRFTVPEGFTARQISERLSQEKLADGEAFLAAVNNTRNARAWGVPGRSLEGFLFPDTYEIPKGLEAQLIARHMVERFREKVKPDLVKTGTGQGLSELQWVTLASIIEREVRAPEERPEVASVFYNRLHKAMRLESCATVLYSQGRSSGTLSLDDLNNPSPYNTYRHRGLPPGPISNPGLSALQAAAGPAQTDYLFFVVRPDGRHVFSEDFEAHKHAKWVQKLARRQKKGTTTPGHP